MPLAERCRHNFPRGAIDRGEQYSRARRVRLTELLPGAVTAEVQGTDRRPYRVSLDWVEAEEDRTLLYNCSCPYAQSGSCCKHLYAVVLDLDAQGVGASVPGRGPLMLTPDSQLDEDDWDDELGWDPEEPVGRPSLPVAAPRRPAWTHGLEAVRIALTSQTDADTRATVVEGEVWYFLDRSELSRSEHLTLHFHTRMRKRDGTWGAFKRLSVDREGGSAFPDDADRMIFQELLGAELNDPRAGWSSWSGSSRSSVSQATLRPPQYDTLLPRLCLTGRFATMEYAPELPLCSAPLQWDCDSPWRLQLRIERATDGSSWNLTGELARGEVRCAVDQPWMIWRRGLFIREAAFHRLEDPAAFPWIVALRQLGAIQVPVSEEAALLESIWNMPHLPPTGLAGGTPPRCPARNTSAVGKDPLGESVAGKGVPGSVGDVRLRRPPDRSGAVRSDDRAEF